MNYNLKGREQFTVNHYRTSRERLAGLGNDHDFLSGLL